MLVDKNRPKTQCASEGLLIDFLCLSFFTCNIDAVVALPHRMKDEDKYKAFSIHKHLINIYNYYP